MQGSNTRAGRPDHYFFTNNASDPVNQLLAVTVRGNTVAGAILKQYAYGYDLAGNRTSE